MECAEPVYPQSGRGQLDVGDSQIIHGVERRIQEYVKIDP